ncbi:MAG: DUF1905 domain-containing protein [Cyclobacteriaceae bacterium]|nr:DUF1905 domain-containing protein [Cyclobacteriaceae bacterium]
MIRFTAKLQKQTKPGGWTYVVVPAAQAKKLKAVKKSFRVKGTLDAFAFAFEKTSLLAMGTGDFFLPVNAAMRKGTGKNAGDKIVVAMEVDESKPKLSRDLLQCLKEEPEASKFFKTLSPYMQYFYSNWIESAKSSHTKTRRLVAVVNSLAQKLNYQEMMEVYKNTIL